jgi:NADPH:quinone reductase-like Zn-dependent oxidoreductase
VAPEGFDAALVLAGGRAADQALKGMKPGGRVAHPNGVEPEPHAPRGVSVQGYDGVPSREVLARLNRWIGSRPFTVAHQLFPLEEAAAAHRAVMRHHLGKLALHVRHLE